MHRFPFFQCCIALLGLSLGAACEGAVAGGAPASGDGAAGADAGAGKTDFDSDAQSRDADGGLTAGPDGAVVNPPPPPPPPPCTPLAGPSVAPVGNLDAATDTYAAGWAKDPDWDGPIAVHIYFDDRLADITGAGLPRGDVGNHAFHQMHASFGYGAHHTKVFAIGVDANGCPDGGNALIGGPTYAFGDCNNVAPLFRGWCTAVPHYWRDKYVDSTRLVGANVVAGLNLSYGGALVELYGRDRGWNLINEQGGASVQLSLWAYAENQEQRLTSLPGKGFPCAGAIDASDGIAWPYNPIQMQQAGCTWAEEWDVTNDVDGSNVSGGTLVTQINDPANYTGTLPMPGVQFQQQTSLESDAYVKLSYHAVNFGTLPISAPHPQEAPAIFLNIGPSAEVSYYGGGAAWTGDAVTTTAYTGQSGRLGFLGRNLRPNDPPPFGQMAEGWYSVCSADHAHCVTVATPLVNASEVWEAGLSHDPASGNFYATLIAYYAFSSGSAHDTTVYMFPYRYDEVVSGKSVRAWICEIAGQSCP